MTRSEQSDSELLTFDSLQGSFKRTRGKCPRCGRPGNADGSVRVGLNRYVPEKSNPVAVTTRAIAFCEPCCVQVYRALEETLLKIGAKL